MAPMDLRKGDSPPMDRPCENPGETPGSVFVADAEKFGRQTE